MPQEPEAFWRARRENARRRTRRRRRAAVAALVLVPLAAAGAVLAGPRLLDDDAPATTQATTVATPSAASSSPEALTAPSGTDEAPAPALSEGSAAASAAPDEAGAARPTTDRAGTKAPKGARPLVGVRVNLDPGHNGGGTAAFNNAVPGPTRALIDAGIKLSSPRCDTSGASTNAGYAESAFNFDVALRARDVLRARGATVTLTRTSNDTLGPCTSERAAIGNRADVAISIHADGGPPGQRGFHVILPGDLPGYTDDIEVSSRRLGTALRDAMRKTGMPDSTYIGSNGLDVRTNLVGLVLSDTPKVFLETGNMRNATDAGLLTSPAFRQRVAVALADALVQWHRGR